MFYSLYRTVVIIWKVLKLIIIHIFESRQREIKTTNIEIPLKRQNGQQTFKYDLFSHTKSISKDKNPNISALKIIYIFLCKALLLKEIILFYEWSCTVVLPSSYRKLLNFNNLRVYTNYKDHRIIISPKPFFKLKQSFTDVFERNNLHILWNH